MTCHHVYILVSLSSYLIAIQLYLNLIHCILWESCTWGIAKSNCLIVELS